MWASFCHLKLNLLSVHIWDSVLTNFQRSFENNNLKYGFLVLKNTQYQRKFNKLEVLCRLIVKLKRAAAPWWLHSNRWRDFLITHACLVDIGLVTHRRFPRGVFYLWINSLITRIFLFRQKNGLHIIAQTNHSNDLKSSANKHVENSLL